MLALPITVLMLALAGAGQAQQLPTTKPPGCDGSTCVGCTPFQPPEGSAKKYPCGINDIYFPVPIYVIRNDTSVDRELESRQWVCFACCSLGCGFDDPQNTCEYTKYDWKEGAKYGCSKCGGKDVATKGGEVKTSFADLTTNGIYSTLVTEYGACAPSGSVPTTSPSPSPPVLPSPIPSPPVLPSPVPSPPVPTVTPPPAPEATTSPATSPPATVPTVQVTPAPAPEAVEVAAPPPFVPIEIGSTTRPESAVAADTTAIAWVSLTLALFLSIFH